MVSLKLESAMGSLSLAVKRPPKSRKWALNGPSYLNVGAGRGGNCFPHNPPPGSALSFRRGGCFRDIDPGLVRSTDINKNTNDLTNWFVHVVLFVGGFFSKSLQLCSFRFSLLARTPQAQQQQQHLDSCCGCAVPCTVAGTMPFRL